EWIDPFRWMRPGGDSLARELAELADVADPRALARRLAELERARRSPLSGVQIAGTGLAASVQLNDPAAPEWLSKFEQALAQIDPRDDLVPVFEQLERALLLAGHLGLDEHVPGLIDKLYGLLGPLRGEQAAAFIGRLSGQLFRTL